MKKQFLVIGLGLFGKRAMEILLDYNVDLVIIDKDEEIINLYKDKVSLAYLADISHLENIEKIIPTTIDVAIVDLGGDVEASTLITNTLRNLGIKEIAVKANSVPHGEILELLGATKVVLPNLEAANRIIPRLINPNLQDYFTMGKDLIIAEIKMPDYFNGKTLFELDLRKNFKINMIAYKHMAEEEYHYFSATYKFKLNDIILIVGNTENVTKFIESSDTKKESKPLNLLKKLFSFKK